jgi:hypothetical protein
MCWNIFRKYPKKLAGMISPEIEDALKRLDKPT